MTLLVSHKWFPRRLSDKRPGLYIEINGLKRNNQSFPRLFGPSTALHCDQDGGGLDLPGPPGADHGAGQLEHGLRQRQESPR